MKIKQISEPAYWARIYIAGNVASIEECCRAYCDEGYCVNVRPTNYIYQYGEQPGAVIELISYARFPEEHYLIERRAETLAKCIAEDCHQRSWTVMTPYTSTYYAREI